MDIYIHIDTFTFHFIHRLTHFKIDICIMMPSLEKKWMRLGPIKSRQSCFFEQKKIEKRLQLPVKIDPLKAPKKRVS